VVSAAGRGVIDEMSLGRWTGGRRSAWVDQIVVIAHAPGRWPTVSDSVDSGGVVARAGRITLSKKLKPGRYMLVITAKHAGGQRSRPRSLTFTIVKWALARSAESVAAWFVGRVRLPRKERPLLERPAATVGGEGDDP
jgi:hypothetical protein